MDTKFFICINDLEYIPGTYMLIKQYYKKGNVYKGVFNDNWSFYTINDGKDRDFSFPEDTPNFKLISFYKLGRILYE